MDRVTVVVFAQDPVSQAGLEHLLRLDADLLVVAGTELDTADVAVVGRELDDDVALTVQGIQRDGCPRVLLVADTVDDGIVVRAAEAEIAGVIRRTEATARTLATAVREVAGGAGWVPRDLVAPLLARIGDLSRSLVGGAVSTSGPVHLSDRESEVLRLVADGHDTGEIADILCYSSRTVKGVLHDVTSRLGLRNRSHAVAYALRHQLI